MQQNKKMVSYRGNRVKILKGVGRLRVVAWLLENNVRRTWQRHEQFM